MKNTIYKYFFHEFLRYFTISLFALAVIAWTVQAVNFLDLITEDGHAFGIYFNYSLLTLSKVLTKLIPLCFLISIVLTILKFEKDNELIALWTSGLNKIHIVNQIFKISLIIMLFQLFLTIFINPTLLNISRSLLKNAELQFVPSLLKEKQFNDTVSKLTIFVNKKNDDGVYENIFIRDEGKIFIDMIAGSSTIIAKSGYITDDEKNMVLLDGYIQKLELDRTVNIVKFEKTLLNLSGISTKSISEPKIQEISSWNLIRCIQTQFTNLDKKHCPRYANNLTDTKIEMNKRLGMPFFIPLISLICSFLLAAKRNDKSSNFYRYICSFAGLVVLAAAEVTVRYSGISWNHTAIYYLLPLGTFPLFYYSLIRTFKYENLS